MCKEQAQILEQGGSLEIILVQPHSIDEKSDAEKGNMMIYVGKMQLGENREKIN